MNCKPNELAIVIDTPESRKHEMVDKIVRVTHLDSSWLPYETCWRFEGRPFITSTGFKITCIPDDHLRPIRNPGDDAEDESKAWLPPVPVLEHA